MLSTEEDKSIALISQSSQYKTLSSIKQDSIAVVFFYLLMETIRLFHIVTKRCIVKNHVKNI